MSKAKSITHTRTFRIRYYESDPNGLLSCSNYLRFMQETAFDASSAAGYDWDQYKKIHRIWVIRDTEIQTIQPAYYDQILLAKTWISDFHGLSSRREYAFFRLIDAQTEETELVAKGFSDWVYLDTEKARPVSIPQELQEKFFPTGVPDSFPHRYRLSFNNNMPNNAFTQTHYVKLQDIDQLQHMNNASYLDYVLETNWQMFASLGVAFFSLQQKGKTLLPHLSRIRYKIPAHYKDSLSIFTWISHLTSSNITIDFMIRRGSDSALLIQGKLEYIYFDLHTQTSTPIPKDMQARIQKQLS